MKFEFGKNCQSFSKIALEKQNINLARVPQDAANLFSGRKMNIIKYLILSHV